MEFYNVNLSSFLSQLVSLLFFLKDPHKHTNNHHFNPLQVNKNVFLYSPQNGYNCLNVWQIDLPQIDYTMLS